MLKIELLLINLPLNLFGAVNFQMIQIYGRIWKIWYDKNIVPIATASEAQWRKMHVDSNWLWYINETYSRIIRWLTFFPFSNFIVKSILMIYLFTLFCFFLYLNGKIFIKLDTIYTYLSSILTIVTKFTAFVLSYTYKCKK